MDDVYTWRRRRPLASILRVREFPKAREIQDVHRSGFGGDQACIGQRAKRAM
ncbi:hypothetical protein LGM58_17270 [Burkholderia contaminans]|uniref:hypothetical protein n=1 Tax=Burkholderia contaminans TaxID=488447 RepID=UPI001CF33AEB|nr:hypothetical protein [Burkholderia contaminans]MCA7884944.1 hypothetical protein [Burkholderia contaminans]